MKRFKRVLLRLLRPGDFWMFVIMVQSAARMLSFVGAHMSMFALQTAMITQFGEGEENFTQIMNTAFGGSVCFIVFAMAIFMIVRANNTRA